MAKKKEGLQGVKNIKLGFKIKYSKGGDENEADTICVKAPGFSQMEINDKISAEVYQALFSSIGRLKDIMGEDPSNTTRDESSDADDSEMTLTQIKIGMEPDKYSKFKKYVLKTLTGNHKLACIANTDIPLKDFHWHAIGEKGGMDAIDKVVSGFLSFFIEDMERKTLSGVT